MVQNLTLAQVKKVSKDVDQKETYEIHEGLFEGHTITFSPIFSDIEIEKILNELQEIIAEIKEKNLDVEDNTINFHLVNLLMIKHFTHLGSQMPSSFVEKGKKAGLLDYLEHFRKTGLYKLIIEKVFIPSEVQKVYSHLTDFISQAFVVMDIENEFKDRVESIKSKNSSAYQKIDEAFSNVEN